MPGTRECNAEIGLPIDSSIVGLAGSLNLNEHMNLGIYGWRASLIAAFCLLASETRGAEGWPNWRGPDYSGSVTRGTPPEKWDVTKPRWKVALPGKGTSVPIVHRGTLYLTSPSEGQDAVIAYDLEGKQRWLTTLGPEEPPKHRTLASSCNSSPVTDGENLYVHFKSGHFASLDFKGKIRWQTNLVEQFGKVRLFWDQGNSPVVTAKHVILPRLHSGDSWVAAFEKSTGRVAWKVARDYKVPNENDNGYTTPVLFKHRGREAVLIWGADHLTAYESASGKALWSVGGFNPEGTAFWPAIATPVIADDLVLVPVGRDDRGQAQVHAYRTDGEGDVSESHRAWKRTDTGVFVPSPTMYQGRLYLLRNKGEIACLDPKTGKTHWTAALPEHRTPYYASPVIANGVLYAAREDGLVFSARVGDRFELLGEHAMGERVIASPVPVGDRLFIRGDSHLFCF